MKIHPWLKTTLVSVLGGAFTGTVAAALDHTKYHFPQDLGSGKLWEFCITGALTAGLSSLVGSPLRRRE
jgi:hypothetical protein